MRLYGAGLLVHCHLHMIDNSSMYVLNREGRNMLSIYETNTKIHFGVYFSFAKLTLYLLENFRCRCLHIVYCKCTCFVFLY